MIAVKHRTISALLPHSKTKQDRSKAKEQSSVSFPECLVEVLIKWRIWDQNVGPREVSAREVLCYVLLGLKDTQDRQGCCIKKLMGEDTQV